MEAGFCAAYVLVHLDGQVSIVADVSPGIYDLVQLVVHIAESSND